MPAKSTKARKKPARKAKPKGAKSTKPRKSPKRKAAKPPAAPASSPTPTGAPDDVLDMAQAIVMLRTTRATFYRWLRSGQVKGMKVGRQWRFRRQDIERFLEGKEPRIDLPTDIAPLIAELESRLSELGVPPEPTGDDGVARAAHLIIRLAAASHASDLHLAAHNIEGAERAGVLRLRLDGVLHETAEVDTRLLPALISRFKTLCACDVHETQRAQTGRLMADLPEGPVDLRFTFVPSALGETLTARLLPHSVDILTLGAIDFSPADRAHIERWLSAPSGLVIITGPAGSGKTTIMYACLMHTARPEVKTVTIEDPVEFVLPWTVQVQVDAEAGLTFGAAARSIRRSDPDVVMVGEVREPEILRMCQTLALTGHLVLTSLHVGDAARALARMVDMGAEPYVIGEATRLIVAVRLVRLVCPDCSVPADDGNEVTAARELARTGGLDWSALSGNFRKPVGCPKCHNTGYRGRTVVSEALQVTPQITAALARGADVDELRSIAVGEGMTTMAADGVRKAAAGKTSLAEVLRIFAQK